MGALIGPTTTSIVAEQSANLVLIESARPTPQFNLSTRTCAFSLGTSNANQRQATACLRPAYKTRHVEIAARVREALVSSADKSI
jgi:hypothetical protein